MRLTLDEVEWSLSQSIDSSVATCVSHVAKLEPLDEASVLREKEPIDEWALMEAVT